MRRVLLMMALAMARPAAAGERAVLIEAAVAGEPSLDAYAPAAQKALGDVLTGAPLAAAIDARIGPPPRALSASALSLLQARVKQSERNLFFNGTRVRESIADLEDARAQLSDAEAALAHDREARALYHYVLVKLTRAYQIEHVPDAARLADARMEELVRLFPDRPLDPEHNEPELFELFQSVQRRLVANAHLALTLSPGAHAYLEGLQVDGTELTLMPGVYRVFAGDGHGEGRVHRVELPRDGRLVIDLPLESALRTDPVVTLTFASPAARRTEEPRLVARLGRALGTSRVYVLGSGGDGLVGIWAYEIGTADRSRLLAAVATRDTPPELTRVAQRLRAELDLGPPTGEPRLIVINARETVDSTHSTASASLRAGASPGSGMRALNAAGWTSIAVGLSAATVGAVLWPRSPGPRAGVPLLAAGGTVALMGSDWVLVLAGIGGRRQLGRTIAIVAAIWAVSALAGGLLQLGH